MSEKIEENPYLNARAEWDAMFGGYVNAADQWRKYALIALSILGLSLIGNIWQGLQSKLRPYVIEKDANDRIISVSVPGEGTISDSMIRASLADWITNFRSVAADPLVQKQFVEKTYALIPQGSAAKQTVDQWYRANNPFERMKTQTVTVEIASVLGLSNKSFQIEWRETTRGLKGEVTGVEQFRALLTIERFEINEDTLFKNPLGIYVPTVSIQKI